MFDYLMWCLCKHFALVKKEFSFEIFDKNMLHSQYCYCLGLLLDLKLKKGKELNIRSFITLLGIPRASEEFVNEIKKLISKRILWSVDEKLIFIYLILLKLFDSHKNLIYRYLYILNYELFVLMALFGKNSFCQMSK